MTKVWAKELGPLGIRCVCVAPGFADTPGAAQAIESQRLESWIQEVPLRRLAAADEIVHGILFAIGNDFFNGKVLQIDGGLVL